MNPLNNPTLCISVAQKPGKFGITVHNTGYQTLGLNYICLLYTSPSPRD